MKQLSTEILIANLYNENTPADTAEIDEQVSQSWFLQEKSNVLTEAMGLLQEGWQHPRAAIIDSILQYAEKRQQTLPA